MGNEVQKKASAPAAAPTHQVALRQMLTSDKMKTQFAAALPKHLTPERFVRVAITAINRTPQLADCTQESFFLCLLNLSAMGLEPDGRRAHLIPFKDNRAGTVVCTLIIDYKGLAELAMRSGVISNIHADVVCENDEFDYNCGQIISHRIDFKLDRGEPYAAYALARFKDGSEKAEVMSMTEVLKIRDGSQGWKAYQKGWAKSSPWADFPAEMAKKTVFRRLSKWLPLSPEYRDAVESDEESVIDVSSISAPAEPDQRDNERRAALVDSIRKLASEKGMDDAALDAAVLDGVGFALDEMDDAMLAKTFSYVHQLAASERDLDGEAAS